MKKSLKQKADDAEKEILEPRGEPPIRDEDLLGTGSTMLNLAMSGRPHGGIAKGFSVLFIGKPQSGKTRTAFHALAEAAYSPSFKDYRLIFDNVENGAHLDIKQQFGKLYARLEAPGGSRKNPVHSHTVEEFYDHLDDAICADRPFVYVVDSMDALVPEKSIKRALENKKNRRADKEVSESYGMDKAKANSEHLRSAVNRMKDRGSILIIICQTRDNVGIGAMYKPDKHGGGNALEFYSRLVVWFKSVGEIKQKVRGHELVVGGHTEAKITKNSINGWKGRVAFDCLRDTGIDDVGSMIDYLVEWRHWKAKDGMIVAPELDLVTTKAEMVRLVEDRGLEANLQMAARKVWHEVEAELLTPRKPRYT